MGQLAVASACCRDVPVAATMPGPAMAPGSIMPLEASGFAMATGATEALGSRRAADGRAHRSGWILLLLVWFAYVAWTAVGLPLDATPTGDSEAYLTLASHRPPVYGWVLNAFHLITGGLDYLPALQFLLFAAGLLIFAIELGRLLGSLFAPAAVILIALHVGIHEEPSWMMSESVFSALVLVGLGLQFRAVRCGGGVSLAGATICFVLAMATRTAGAAFLLIPLLATLFDRRRSLTVAAVRTGRVVLVAALALSVVMAGNWLKSGRFEIGSWTGISLLGKGLLLTEASDVADLPPPAASVIPAARDLRALIAAQPDLAARLRAQGQAYQDLRFPIFYPAAEQSWPAWAHGDLRERGELALALSRQVIARHPWEYAELWAHDWMALVLYPQYWPAWASVQADGALFPACRLHANCWVLKRNDVPARTLLSMLVVSVIGTIGGAALLVLRSWRVLRRRADPRTVLFWTLALVVQATLLMSSAFEVGIARYANATHVLGVALLLWFVSMVPIRAVLGRFVSARSRMVGRWFGSRRGAAHSRSASPGSARHVWTALFSRDALLFSGFYSAGILAGVVIFWLCFSAGALSSIHILFYRGLSLVVVAMLVHLVAMSFALGWVRRLGKGSLLSVAHVLPIVVTGAALNLAFFVLVPVSIDRSISVFLLSWMQDHHDTPQTKADLRRAFLQIYVDGYGAIDRRIDEQLASGDIAPSGDGYILTERGTHFVAVARQIGHLFTTDRRFLYPAVTTPAAGSAVGPTLATNPGDAHPSDKAVDLPIPHGPAPG